jgi:parallel beta-helix repeat protein
MSRLVIKNNILTGSGLAGIKLNAMKEMPTIEDNTISGNNWGLQLYGDSLAPLTTTYTFNDLVVTGSTQEGFYAQDITIQLRSSSITGSTQADLAVRRARIDCY